eukprot:2419631-Amphidinium_carterae.1
MHHGHQVQARFKAVSELEQTHQQHLQSCTSRHAPTHPSQEWMVVLPQRRGVIVTYGQKFPPNSRESKSSKGTSEARPKNCACEAPAPAAAASSPVPVPSVRPQLGGGVLLLVSRRWFRKCSIYEHACLWHRVFAGGFVLGLSLFCTGLKLEQAFKLAAEWAYTRSNMQRSAYT